jgi:hypothetical protein
VKVLKLLVVPAVVLLSLVMAAPAFAHGVTAAKLTQAECQNGQICVTLTGNVASGTDERHVFVDIFAKGSDQSLGEVKFVVPENHTGQTVAMTPDTECFKAVSGDSSATFILKIVKVTQKDDKTPGDLSLELTNSNPPQTIQFPTEDNKPVEIKNLTLAQCPPPSTPTPTPTATATPVAALANTGGLDLRFPLIGLTVLVAGLALLLVSFSRGRSTPTK